MNIEQARRNMIDQQICVDGGVRSQDVLDLFNVVRREHFVPADSASLAFADTEIPLPCGASMLRPQFEARILEALALKPHEQVLEIGAGSGFMAALLAYRTRHVTTVEIEPVLKALAENNLSDYAITNVTVELGNGACGWDNQAYDVIVISGALPFLPDHFLRQIKLGGRIVAFIGAAPNTFAQIVTRQSDAGFVTQILFPAAVQPLQGAPAPQRVGSGSGAI